MMTTARSKTYARSTSVPNAIEAMRTTFLTFSKTVTTWGLDVIVFNPRQTRNKMGLRRVSDA